MGTYVYKVTRHTVELSNGEVANVAVFAYKPTWNPFASTTNEQMHVRSGAARCDANADQRSDWIVLGFYNEQTKKIEVEIESVAKKLGKRGSLEDSFFDFAEREQSNVAASLCREVQLTKTKRHMLSETEGEDVVYKFDRRRAKWIEDDRYKFFTSAA